VTREAVFQRKHDECLRACVSFLLGIPYDELPDVSAADDSTDDFWSAWVDWGRQRGKELFFYYDGMPAATEWIAVVPSLNQPGKDHAVVMQRARLVHDPVSHGERYDKTPAEIKYGITLGDS